MKIIESMFQVLMQCKEGNVHRVGLTNDEDDLSEYLIKNERGKIIISSNGCSQDVLIGRVFKNKHNAQFTLIDHYTDNILQKDIPLKAEGYFLVTHSVKSELNFYIPIITPVHSEMEFILFGNPRSTSSMPFSKIIRRNDDTIIIDDELIIDVFQNDLDLRIENHGKREKISKRDFLQKQSYLFLNLTYSISLLDVWSMYCSMNNCELKLVVFCSPIEGIEYKSIYNVIYYIPIIRNKILVIN